MVNNVRSIIMKHKITFSKFKGFDRIVELETLQDAIFDYGTIIIKEVVS